MCLYFLLTFQMPSSLNGLAVPYNNDGSIIFAILQSALSYWKSNYNSPSVHFAGIRCTCLDWSPGRTWLDSVLVCVGAFCSEILTQKLAQDLMFWAWKCQGHFLLLSLFLVTLPGSRHSSRQKLSPMNHYVKWSSAPTELWPALKVLRAQWLSFLPCEVG